MERMTKPYERFAGSHLRLMYALQAVAIAAIWIFVSRTLALVIVSLYVLAYLWLLALVWWRRSR